MKKTVQISIFILTLLFSISSWSQKIVYPWRATTAIVKSGENFEVWFNAADGQTINSVELRGPFNTVTATITNTATDTWVYDKWSGNTCNRKLSVNVPANTPSDRYDLILKTSTGDEISLAAVKVLKEFKNNFYVLHFSDAHRWQGSYDTPNIILREISTIIDIANIIDPEMIIETGDNHYQNTANEASSMDRINQYMNGFMNGTDYVNGMNNAFAPVFTAPGNHDTPQKNYELEPGYPTPGYEKIPSLFYNKFYGLQAHNFAYGDVRFIGVNNSWFPDDGRGTPNFSHQTDEAVSWLNTVGKGTMRIGYCHVNTGQPSREFNNPLKAAGAPLNLLLVGHVHSITYSPYVLDDKKIEYSATTVRDGLKRVPFNLYKIDASAGTYETISNEQAYQEGLETAKSYNTAKLKLTYSALNDGATGNNTATIVNKFSFPITGARVRFVVPKGSPYYVRNAVIKQEFDGTNFHIVDATYNLEPNSTTIVSIHAGIQEDLCPLDPNKMDPGLCGCGVAEGTCPVLVTDILFQPTVIRLNIDTSRLLVPTIVPANATNKAVIWESSNPSAISVNAFGKITALSEGSAIITGTTVDGGKKVTINVSTVMDTVNYQAEDAEYVGPLEVTNQPGYKGNGFLDYTNASNDYIKWTVNVPADGNYNLGFRYAILSNNRPLRLTINDEIRNSSTPFTATGSWSNWRVYTTTQALVAGNNTIILTATGASGGNFDELSVTGTLGVHNFGKGQSNKSVRVSPNPLTSGILTVATDGFDDDTNIRIYITTANGQKIYENKLNDPCHTDINLAGKLSNSIYFVTVESDQSKVVKKLIVQQ
ncbi:Ig-like domain-containing protein [Flavobacterium nackdongense]|nr:Ig-like domain-containing protein [Flavobacterium nackdongense]